MTSLSPFKKRARDIRSDMWDSFTDFFNDNFFAPVRSDTHLFRTDIKDSGDRYVIEAELPGFEKEDIKVEYDHHYLMISARRESISKDEKENYLRQERHFGEFVRRFYVEDIDENAIDATFNNGVLTLNCLKLLLAKPDQKRIEIH
jgi:HSP20 family protein